MPVYRTFTIGSDGRAFIAKDFECADDQKAIDKTRQVVSELDIELWERGRFIARMFSKETPL
jgi:hypothetical protein